MNDTIIARPYRIRRWEITAMSVAPALLAIVRLNTELSALSLVARALAVWAIAETVVARGEVRSRWASTVHLSASALVFTGLALGGQTELVIAVFLEMLLAIGLMRGWVRASAADAG